MMVIIFIVLILYNINQQIFHIILFFHIFKLYNKLDEYINLIYNLILFNSIYNHIMIISKMYLYIINLIKVILSIYTINQFYYKYLYKFNSPHHLHYPL